MQVSGAEKVLYGLDDVRGVPEVIIVEGEMDKLALEEAGLRNTLSVPDGAPREVRAGDVPPPDADTKYAYLWNCRAVLDQAARIVLATDGDAPGQACHLPCQASSHVTVAARMAYCQGHPLPVRSMPDI